jgi:tetratricopeptide (TPR) repeat protein
MMIDELTNLVDEYLRSPRSLAFLDLAERLRTGGRLEAAVRVALTGLEHYPTLSAAHDLYARILLDIGDLDRAETIWRELLEREKRHVGALTGLGGLYASKGDYDSALDHLERALAVDPADAAVVQALMRVRRGAEDAEGDAAGVQVSEQTLFRGLDGAGRGMLLADRHGQMLGGRLETPAGDDVSEPAAAHVASVAREATRTADMLGLGPWLWLTIEAAAANLHLSAPDDQSLLLVVLDRSMPAGRLARLAERAAETARGWLEEQFL